MKRKHKKIYEYKINKHYSLFGWYKCNNCGLDFRREKGFCFQIGPFYRAVGRFIYLCSTCAPIIDDANEYALSKKWMPKRPKCPPPPPPPRNVKSNI